MTCSKVVRAMAIAGVMVLSLSGCGFLQSFSATSSTPRCVTRTEQPKTMTDVTNSRLDEAGLKEVYKTCRVTFDLTKNQLLKEDLGLPATARYVPNLSTDGLLTLTLHGSKGTLEARTDRIRFFSVEQEGWVDEISYFLTADTPEEFFAILRDGAEAYGFDPANVEGDIAYMKNYPDRGLKHALQPGYKLGFQVQYDLRYKGPGHVNTVIVSIDPTSSEPRPIPGL